LKQQETIEWHDINIYQIWQDTGRVIQHSSNSPKHEQLHRSPSGQKELGLIEDTISTIFQLLQASLTSLL
jgi:hypothetical protein